MSLSSLAVDVLTSQHGQQLQERLHAGATWKGLDLVFATRRGGPLEAGNVVRSFKRLLAQAGLPSMRFHDLRHSCATLLLAAGVPARVVMDILGHSQIGLTMNTYSHVLPALQVEAASRLDALLDGDGPAEGGGGIGSKRKRRRSAGGRGVR